MAGFVDPNRSKAPLGIYNSFDSPSTKIRKQELPSSHLTNLDSKYIRCRSHHSLVHFHSHKAPPPPTKHPTMADATATQPHNLPLHISPEKCAGRTYIVTGANVGLGLEAAKHLVAVGAAKVIMAVRNVSAGEAAKADIEAATGASGVAEVWALDLASYDSVKAFAKRAVSELERIDALIENAGVAAFDRTMAEGHLLNITVNVLSTLLLAVLLLPKMSEDAKKFGIVPHIVVVSSRVGFDAEADWNLIKGDPLVEVEKEDHPGLKMYATISPIH